MKKSLDEGFITPHSVLIIGTYDENGTPDQDHSAVCGNRGRCRIRIGIIIEFRKTY